MSKACLEVVTSGGNEIQVVALHGELDVAGAPEATRQLTEVSGSIVVADLTGLTFIDASGIGALLTAKEKIEADSHSFVIRGAKGLVRRVFSILELDDMLSE